MARDETLQPVAPGAIPDSAGSPSPTDRERTLSAILNSLSDAVITVDREHRISSVNRAAERLIGLSATEVLGKDCRTVMSANFGPEQHTCPMGDVAEGGGPRSDVDGTL